MKMFIASILILLVLTACYTNEHHHTDEGRHFDITFKIDQEESEKVSLSFEIVLDSGYYFVSPHSEGFHQILLFSVEETDSLLLDGELLESPLTIEEHDEVSNKPGRFARENTTYTQSFNINTENDFEIDGLIWFEMRPNNQPYEIRFTISNKSGSLIVEKNSTSTSGYPTFWDKKRIDISADELN